MSYNGKVLSADVLAAVVKHTKTSGRGGYPSITRGYAIQIRDYSGDSVVKSLELDKRGNVRFFQTLEGAYRALARL